MLKKTLLVVFLLSLFSALPVSAQPVSVVVAPFSIHSQEDLNYLSQGIQEMIIGHLLQRGIQTASKADVEQAMKGLGAGKLDGAKARKMGQAMGAAYVVFGSLTKVGNHLSLDAKIVDTTGAKETVSVFAQAEGLDNLNAGTEKLAQEASLTISGSQRILRIEIIGNDRIETEAVKRVLQTKEGDIFSEATLSLDLKRVYGMDYFEDVKVGVEDTPSGKVVQFLVQEKPAVQEISLRGNKLVEEEDLREVLGYKLYSILNHKKIVESVQQMKALYRGKGYYNADISYEIQTIDQKSVAIRYEITEGRRIYIRQIVFVGNEHFSDFKLRRKMESKKWNIFSWATSAGILDIEVLKTDVKRLTAWYLKHGYLDVKISEPEVEVLDNGLRVTINIAEGNQYRAGNIIVTGDLVVPEEAYLDKLKIKKGDILDRQLVQEDMQTVTSMTADHGYAFAEVDPQLDRSKEDDRALDINYIIHKKDLVYFERITITGNDKTRDKVIRRELKAKEGELFSSEGLRVSQVNLDRLGYFEEVQIVQNQGSAPDLMDLDIKVKEKPTGEFSIGAGYSSFDSLFATASITQKNLFGTGRILKLEATVGGSSDQVVLSYTEPYIFDTPLAGGFDVFYRTVDYDEYSKEGKGFYLRAGYLVTDFVRVTGRYRYEWVDIFDIDDNAADEIKEIEGKSTTSSVIGMISQDNRNKYFNPTEGSENWFSVEFAGNILGGSNSFIKYQAETSWYFPNPLFDESAFHIRGKAGYVTRQPGGELPTYEKFYLGGLDSVRGFSYADISPVDAESGDAIGGEKMALFNLEFTFPILKSAGIIGVVFLDHGNVWRKSQNYDLTDLKRSYGAGIRWNSPMGPLRLEYGKVIDPDEGDPDGQWEFSVGGTF